ncbi:hypothetical protein ASG73_06270 [Janibacter sp. Soil728]|uniref:hypothetical protein n=1 Tax=Janibacter sp. Soil728 TaxID=1736393 RepID=UPI000701B18A|nr:hypothetical protein [Janibacter sp. Soil728]KRE38531.1 hypothetical protein ASG73_06270 [Janibacter sp. Soil728]
MQATVFSHAPDSPTVVVTDDGLRLQAQPHVFAASGLRFVRPGQRVSITVEDGVVTRLWIVGIGDGETIG